MTIEFLYPELCNLYGDRGNVLCLKRRLEWRGLGAACRRIPARRIWGTSLGSCSMRWI